MISILSLNEIFLLIITAGIFILPGYLIIAQTGLRNISIIEKVFYGFCVSVSLSTILGYIFSFFKVLSFVAINMTFYILNVILLFYHFFYSKNENIKEIKNNFNSKFKKNLKNISYFSLIVVGIFLIAFFIAYIFESHALLPTTWDRGKHFSYMVYILNHDHLPSTVIGAPSYEPYYPNGFHTSASIFVDLFCFISSTPPQFSSYDDILYLAKPFIFFSIVFIALIVLGIYCLVKRISQRKLEATVAAFMSLIFIEYSAGSLVHMSSFCLISLPITLMIEKLDAPNKNSNKIDILLLISLITLVLFRIIAVAFTIIIIFLSYSLKVIQKQIKIKNYFRIIIVIFSSLCVSAFILFLCDNRLFGMLDTFIRKENILSMISKPKMAFLFINSSLFKFILSFIPTFDYFISKINYFINNPFYPFLLVGIIFGVYDKKRRYFILALLIAPWFLEPFPPFGRFQYYLIYIYPIIASLGLSRLITFTTKIWNINILPYIINKIKKIKTLFNNRLRKLWAIIKHSINKLKNSNWEAYLIICSILLFFTLPKLNIILYYNLNPGKYRAMSYINKNSIKTKDMILNSTFPNDVIVSPLAGPNSFLLSAILKNRQILIATPRSDRTPSYVELVKVYNKFVVEGADTVPKNTTNSERKEIIQKYKIDAIIFNYNAKINETYYKTLYPNSYIYGSLLILNKSS